MPPRRPPAPAAPHAGGGTGPESAMKRTLEEQKDTSSARPLPGPPSRTRAHDGDSRLAPSGEPSRSRAGGPVTPDRRPAGLRP